MTEGKNELPKLEGGLENQFKVVLTPEEVRKIQEERKPLTPEQIAEIETKIKGVQDRAKSEIKEIMKPAVQADSVLSTGVILDTIPNPDHILYIVEVETENGKEILERRWYFGPTVKEENKGKFITTKLSSPTQ